MNYQTLLHTTYWRAEQQGVDRSTRNCALLINPVTGEEVAYGLNRYPSAELANDSRNHERLRKYAFIEHAERDAIFKCAKNGIATQGLIMVCPWACCPECARAIVFAGIPLVVAHKQAFDMTPERWREPIEQGMEILQSGGVVYHLWDGKVDEVQNLFNGSYWRP